MRACGVLETIRISAAGYPSRWTYRDFYQRYHALLPRGYFRKGEEHAMTIAILRGTIKVRSMIMRFVHDGNLPLPAQYRGFRESLHNL